jgi:cellulose biosynthesis protein BcsQ
VFLIPGNWENMNLPSASSNIKMVLAAFQPLADTIDCVIVDTAPSQSLFHVAVYVATDMIVYPTLLEDWSVEGVTEAWVRREEPSLYRQSMGLPAIQVAGIQPMRVQGGLVLQQDMHSKLVRTFGEQNLLPSIGQRTVWAEAAAKRCSIFAYDPTSRAAEEAQRFVGIIEQSLLGV